LEELRRSKMLKIIIPLAGSSELFSNVGYFYPKPLIEVNGTPMIEKVLDNPLRLKVDKTFIFIIREEDSIRFHLDNALKILVPGCEVVKLANDTKGGLCSVLMAIDLIGSDDEILILNGDQLIDVELDTVYQYWKDESADAGLVSFKSIHPRWAYARVENEIVVQTAEKNPISNHALAGVYYFKTAKEFFNCAFNTIRNDAQINGAFYISPVINNFILNSFKVVSYKVESTQYHLFYSPQVLQDYERSETNKK
jgi:NDP-sugar pyrophosphorylase family protein